VTRLDRPLDWLRTRQARVAGALAIVYVVWGSTYLGIKIAIDTLPPMLMAGARFLVAGGLLWLWCVARNRGRTDVERPTWRQWRAATIAGTLMLVGGNGAVTWAELRIDSGIAALLVATVPLWMALLAWLWQGERLRPTAITGLVTGFAGVALLLRPDGHGTDLWGSLLVVAGAFCWAAGSLYVRRAPMPADALRGTAMQMLAGAGVFTVIGVAIGEPAQVDLGAVSAASALALAYLVVFGSLVAFTAYTWLLRNAAPSTVSTYAYVNPAVAVLLGALILAEPITSAMLGSAALIVVGVALIVTGRRSAEPVELEVPAGDAQPAPAMTR
jgi:drug/metabolite transporter (DMT)-like permease